MSTEILADSAIEPKAEQISQAPESDQDLAQSIDVLKRLSNSVKSQVLGRDDVIELAIIALIADGHVLLEDFPGSGKTTLAKALGEALVSEDNADEEIVPFRRIQFTPDLLPSDVTGVPVFDTNTNAFHFRHGPLFAHVVLADEINRTSPKVQSAMLEAMGEKQVTVDNVTYRLDDLFFVIATQNPLDLVGTYPLPTPQLDRFLFKITMDHIDRDAELGVLDTYRERRDKTLAAVTVTRNEVLEARRNIEQAVNINAAIKECLVDISRNLRADDRVLQGNSTRSMVLMLPALQVSAALKGRSFVSADDIELLLPRVLGHRIEIAPGVTEIERVLRDCMRPPIEQLARSTLD
jgi:MoxR-like ATPase